MLFFVIGDSAGPEIKNQEKLGTILEFS